MAHDASGILGSAQLAGVKVNPRGFGKSQGANFTGMYAGVVGAVISATAVGKANKKKAQAAAVSTAPKFGRLAYLAVTADELALIELKTKGAMGLELGGVIVRLPRAEVSSGELAGGQTIFSPPLTITLASGDTWLLEVPRQCKKQAKEVVGTLGGEARVG